MADVFARGPRHRGRLTETARRRPLMDEGRRTAGWDIMPGIDLSTLTAPELRQLLRLARGRHDGLLIDRVEWEIAQRKSLESRVGVDLRRSAPSLIEDGDVTIDEVRAFRRPEPGLPPPRRRSGSGRVSAMLGGLVAGSALTAGAFASAGSGWRLPATIEIPTLPRMAFAERPPAPRPVLPPKPVVVAAASSDAVAGILAPEAFPPPPPPPVEVVEVPPPAPVEVAEVITPPIVETPEPPKAKPEKPKPEKAKVEKAKVEKAKTDKPKLAEKKKPTAKAKKTELAKKKPDAKAKTALAAKTPSGKAKLAAKKDPKAKTTVAAKKEPKAKAASAKAKDASKTKLAAKDKPKTKVAAKPASKATVKAEARKPAPKTALAKAPAKPKAAAKAPAKPKAQVAEAAPQGEAQDTIGAVLARAENTAQ
jgi:hypothetical protein